MAYFPFFVDLKEKRGLIIGGGAVALRKIRKLLPYGPVLTVTAPEICEEIQKIPGIILQKRAFCPKDIENMYFVIAASDDRGVNRQAAVLCRKQNIPVNVADDADGSSFLFPALVKRGELSVGISTGGGSPTAARCLKEQIGNIIPEHIDEILEFLHEKREEIKKEVPEEKTRSRILKELFYSCIDCGRALSDDEMRQIVRRKKDEENS